MIKSSPEKIRAQGTDWRFLTELKKEMKEVGGKGFAEPFGALCARVDTGVCDQWYYPCCAAWRGNQWQRTTRR
jgi:hypothetical protein